MATLKATDVNGNLKATGHIFGYNYTNNHSAPAFVFDKNGSNFTGIGSHNIEDTIWFGAVNSSDYSWNDSFKQKWKFNGSIEAVDNLIAGGEISEGGSSLSSIYQKHKNGNVTSFDDMLTDGEYHFDSTATGSKPKSGDIWGKLIVKVNDGGTHNNSSNWIWQTALMTGGQGIYFRGKTNSSSWTSWKKIIDADDLSTGLSDTLTSAKNASVRFGGDLTGMGPGSPASTVKTFVTSEYLPNGNMFNYNHSGEECSLLFGFRPSDRTYGTILKWTYANTYLWMLRYEKGTWKSSDWEKISAGYSDSSGSISSTSDTASGCVRYNNSTGALHIHSTSTNEKIYLGNETYSISQFSSGPNLSTQSWTSPRGVSTTLPVANETRGIIIAVGKDSSEEDYGTYFFSSDGCVMANSGDNGYVLRVYDEDVAGANYSAETFQFGVKQGDGGLVMRRNTTMYNVPYVQSYSNGTLTLNV